MRTLAALLAGVTVAIAVATAMGLVSPALESRPPLWRARRLGSLRVEGVSPLKLVGASVAGGAVTFAVVWAFTGAVLVALVPAAVVATAPHQLLRRQTLRQERERLRAWPDALRALVASLQAGSSLHASLVELARSGPVPLRDVWARYERLTGHGLAETRALEVLRTELAHPVSDQVIEALIVASDKGSRVALVVLRDLADATTADIQVAERIETAGTEQRLSALVVFVVPWLTLVLLCGRPGPFRDFYSSPAGAQVLLLGAAMSTGGMAVVRRLGRPPTEPRVLLDASSTDGGRP